MKVHISQNCTEVQYLSKCTWLHSITAWELYQSSDLHLRKKSNICPKSQKYSLNRSLHVVIILFCTILFSTMNLYVKHPDFDNLLDMLAVFFLSVLLSFPTCLSGLALKCLFPFALPLSLSLSLFFVFLLPVACQTPSVVQYPLPSTSHTRLLSPLSPLL